MASYILNSLNTIGNEAGSLEAVDTMSENNWHETQTRVRCKDTDRIGVVYY
jgi:hypothetical protein